MDEAALRPETFAAAITALDCGADMATWRDNAHESAVALREKLLAEFRQQLVCYVFDMETAPI
jgi:hypothetical protein